MAEVELIKVIKRFGATEVVHGVDLKIRNNEFIVLVGPSGCGKSTILRMIAGLESLSGGEIRINAQTINQVPPKDRNVAMVFQNYALYPHMSVYENMAFSLRMQRWPVPCSPASLLLPATNLSAVFCASTGYRFSP